MTGKTSIEWTEQSWNPIVGCSIVSPGCTNCYAMGMAYRFKDSYLGRKWAGKPAEAVARSVNGKAVWTGQLALAPDHILLAPLKRKKPTVYFVNSMGDLFHEDTPVEWIDKVFAVMALTPQHTYQVLTKRAGRMRDYASLIDNEPVRDTVRRIVAAWPGNTPVPPSGITFPLPNVWLGISAERQQEWDERKEHLRATPAAVHFASFEPLLGGIIEPSPMSDFLQWAIVGGESGPGARPMHPQWARDIRDQCSATGVEFFFKQYGSWAPCDAINVSRDHALCGLMAAPPHVERDWAKALGFLQKTKGIAGADVLAHVGKKAGGRLLDGIEHNGFPNAPVSA